MSLKRPKIRIDSSKMEEAIQKIQDSTLDALGRHKDQKTLEQLRGENRLLALSIAGIIAAILDLCLGVYFILTDREVLGIVMVSFFLFFFLTIGLLFVCFWINDKTN